MRCHLITFIRLLFVVFPIAADGSSNPIQVAKDGSGDFTTIQKAIEYLNDGAIRVAEPTEKGWKVNEWIKKAIILTTIFPFISKLLIKMLRQ